MQPLCSAKSEHQLLHIGVGGDPLSMLKRIDKARSRHHLESFVDSNDKFGRHRRSFD